MRHIKKTLSVLLAVVMVLSAFSGLSLEAGALGQDCLDVMEQIVNLDAFRQTLAEGFENCTKEIVIYPTFQIKANETNQNAISSYILYYMPEYFHVNTIQFGGAGGYYYQINFTYTAKYGTAAKYAAAKREFDVQINSLLAGIKGNRALNDEQKALLIHDRLVAYLDYDLGVYTESPDPDSYNMTGVVFKQVAVCDGYCKAYAYLLKQVGIKCLVVNSNLMRHAWNIAFIDNVPYYVDCTWDDPLYTYAGYVGHNNFLRSLDGLIETGHHENGKVDYTTTLNVNNTKYDTYYWQYSTTQFQLIQNTIYYFDNLSGELHSSANQDEALYKVQERWCPNPSQYYTDNFSKLASDGKSLFFNQPYAVFKFNVATGECNELFTPEKNYGAFYCIYGLRFKEGEFTYEICNDANFDPDTMQKYVHTRTYITSYELTVSCDQNMGMVTGAGEYSEMERVKIKATAKPGYYFKEFVVDGVVVQSDGNVLNWLVTKDVNVYAHFEKCEHPALSLSYFQATCTKEGGTLYYCPDCGYERREDVEPALGHEWGDWIITKESSCSEEGSAYHVCARDTTHVETQAIPKKAHTPGNTRVKDNIVEPTCTENGSYDIIVLCTICGGAASSTTYTTPALGHKWGEWTTSVVATCAQEGKEVKICKNDPSHTQSRKIGKLAHVPGEAHREDEVPATCAQEGSYNEVVRCINCKEKLSVTSHMIAKPDHTWQDAETIAPKAYSLGYTLHKCKVCGAKLKTDFKDPTGKLKNFKCKTRSSTTQKLVWDRVAGASGYQIQISSKDGKKWGKSADVGTANVINVSGLVAGSPYKFRTRFYMKDSDGKVHYAPWTTLTSPSLPTGTTITKMTPATKAVTLQWKKNSTVSGYQIQVSLTSGFSSAKTLVVKSPKVLKGTIKSLRSKKTYYVRIRTMKTIAGGTYYSAWSKPSKVKIK